MFISVPPPVFVIVTVSVSVMPTVVGLKLTRPGDTSRIGGPPGVGEHMSVAIANALPGPIAVNVAVSVIPLGLHRTVNVWGSAMPGMYVQPPVEHSEIVIAPFAGLRFTPVTEPTEPSRTIELDPIPVSVSRSGVQ